tara:strand:- start:946 stop:1554 length:609 start_codon:yes stop_codon:yes gene_type:complete
MAPASAAVPKRNAAPTADTPERSRDQVRALLREGTDSVMDTSSVATAANSAGSSEQSLAAVDRASAAATPVSLVMVTSADILWIEVLEDQLLRKEQLQLVAAMARAVRGTNVHCAHQQFDWPPVHQPALSNAKGGMSDMLKGFIQRLIRDRATQQMVLMGPCDCLPDTGLPLLEIPSSVSMLRDGSLKQQAWGVLKRLRARA